MGEVHHRQPCRASRADIEATLTDAERELRRIEKERLNLDEMLMKGQTTERRHAQLNAGLDEDEQLHAARSNEAAAALAAIQAESTFFDAAQEMFVRMRKGGTATQAAKREVVHALVESVLVRRIDGEPAYTLNWKVEVPATNIHVSGST